MNKKITLGIIVVTIAVIVGLAIYFSITGYKEKEEKKLSVVLNVYNWEEYLAPDTLSNFEEEFGVEVNLEFYEEEDIALSSVQSDPSKHDIIVISDGLVREMRELKLLAPIDLNNIPNFKNIANKFKNPPYDPGNNYSVPYMWGTTGIVVNRKYVNETENSWSILWNPDYEGKIAMLPSREEVISAALKYLGYPLASTDPAELEEARQLLLEQKPLLKGYIDTITIREQLISEELWAAHEYSGEGVFASAENENVEYIIPKEGCTIWTDNLAIPRDSPHKYTAEVFINYILRPNVSADIANYLWYANCNEAAEEFTDPEVLTNPGLYPSEEALSNSEYLSDLSEAEAIWNQIWAELQLA